ncbi:unnamed protein product [Withania somnifera]
MIPVVFSGDLAHIVACHVKENDCVYMSGKFSMDPLTCKFVEEYQSCFHIISDSLSGLGCDDSVNSGGRKLEEGVMGGDDWRDLVRNPKQWWDCRKAKLDGNVKARHPDFKKKGGRLEFDVYAPKSKGDGKEVDSWKDLLENPDKWWDNRAKQINEKLPDFKHKNTGIGLWVNSSPDWVLSQLPQRAASSDK